jgi:FkbM family methyltransferase
VRPELIKKLEIEAAMHAAPQDRALRKAYFDHLGSLAVAHTGLLTAVLPEIGAPLYFRCGTPDIAVMASIFRDDALAFETRATPTRILLLGAYAGYTAVDLARRFPRARILAVEPLAENFRLLQLNTCMFPRIATRNVAAWHNPTRLAPTQRFQGDWAVRLHDEDIAEERTVEARSVAQLIDDAGWTGAEMVFCDASGAEREVFANPMAAWLTWVDVAVIGLHERVAPRATEWVNKALMAPVFQHRKLGGMELFERVVPKQALPPAPPALNLIRAEPGLTRFVLADAVPTPYGFFVFGGTNCQLHPNPVGGKPARAVFILPAEGHRRFSAGVRHGGRYAGTIVFAAAVQREDGTIAGQAAITLRPRITDRLRFDLDGPVTGTVRVILQTAMAPDADNANMAWAQWLDPKLT